VRRCNAIILRLVIDKFFPNPEAALADLPDGATVMIGGFGNAGMPAALIDALIARGARDLTIVNNNAGNGDTGLAALLKAKRNRNFAELARLYSAGATAADAASATGEYPGFRTSGTR